MTRGDWRDLDASALRDWPAPAVADDADKEVRGRVLVAGGSSEIAGAVQLAAVSALRAGAGKLVIATAQSVAVQMSRAVPEARVIAIRENKDGSFEPGGIAAMDKAFDGLGAVLAGPGLAESPGNVDFIRALLDQCRSVPVVLDAFAMDAVVEVGRFTQPVLVTPHAGEMAHLLGIAKDEVVRDAQRVARLAASAWNAVVALKGATTWIATPEGACWRHACREPGLATSGSGDVLAGLVAGFAARGLALEQACAWGVVMHAMAGETLSKKMGPLGYLARELPREVPALMKKVMRPVRRSPAPTAS
ncbi:MAG TPA: NAD(P)H-hydrate dehydratase [Ramlibacter sp.]